MEAAQQVYNSIIAACGIASTTAVLLAGYRFMVRAARAV